MVETIHRLEFRVRYAEADRLGQVHSSRFAVYMEMGRTEMLRAAGMNYHQMERSGALMVVARLAIDFHHPAHYDDVLTLETRVTRATTARIDHAYRLLRGDDLLAEGRTTLACVSPEGQVRRMPDELLALLGVM